MAELFRSLADDHLPITAAGLSSLRVGLFRVTAFQLAY